MSNSCSSSTSGNPKDQRTSKSVKITSEYTSSVIRKAINEKLLKNVVEQKKNNSKPPTGLVSTSTLSVSTSKQSESTERGSSITEKENNTQTLPDGESKVKDIEVKTFINSRVIRNEAEKKRRDKLNGLIQDLLMLVPHVAESPRRVDKTAVLRFSAHGLRINYVFGKSGDPNSYDINQATIDALFNLVDGFLLTVTVRGQIVLVSTSIEQYLGHCQTDLFGQNLLSYTHPDDHEFLKKQLIPTDLKAFDEQPVDENGEVRPRTEQEEKEIDEKLKQDKRRFTIRIARAGPRSEPKTYETVTFDGCFRRADSAPRGCRPTNYPMEVQMLRRGRTGRDDLIPLHSISGNDIVLIAVGKIVKPPMICERLLEACKLEYRTRHLIDGRIVMCDQRISIVAGYMADEVSGLSPFTFMHKDDVRWVMVALRQMYDYSKTYGESCYRLMTRTGQFIYLRTRGYLDIDQGSNQVRSFVCHNTLVEEEEGKKLVREMKKKFAIMIEEADLAQAEGDVPGVESPAQLERAIVSMITNLQHTQDNEDEAVLSPPERQGSTDGHESDTSRSAKSPPLAIIAPKVSTIITSLTRSVEVVSTASKCIGRYSSSESGDEDYGNENENTKSSKSNTSDKTNMSRPSVLQKASGINKATFDSGSTSHAQKQQSPKSDYKTNFNETISTTTIVIDQTIKIKEEHPNAYDENQCSPLPTSSNYFDKTSFDASSSFSENLASPLECKPFVLDSSTYSQQITSSQFTTSNNSAQYQQFETNNFSNLDSNYIDSSSMPLSNLKRTHSIDDLNSSTKRRFCDNDENTTSSTAFVGKSEYSLQTCIDQLTDPNLDLEDTLPSSFQTLDDSLLQIQDTATELRGQCSTYSNQQIEEIIEEHEEQREMLDNLRQEYNDYMENETR